MTTVKKVVHTVLLPLQLSLGIFLIMKTTPLWAVIHCTLAYLLDCLYFPYTDYKQLHGFKGRVFKKVVSHATTAGDVSKAKKQKVPNKPKNLGELIANSEMGRSVSVVYLGQRFELQRMEGDKMQVKIGFERKDGEKISMKVGPAYYITDKMWETVQYIGNLPPETVFVKNHKEIWEEVIAGDIMEFEGVLDSVILDNRAVVRLDHDYFLPINLLLAEDKLQRTLNFVGLFLNTQKQIHWLIPACLSFTAVVMGFSTTLRLSIIDCISKIFCRGVQFLCDLLPLAMRRSAYSWGSWVDRLKPSNDFRSKIVKGDADVFLAGGAKFDSKSQIQRIIIADCLPLVDEICSAGGPFLFRSDPNCDSNHDSNCDSFYIEWIFDNTKCSLKAGRVASNETRSSLTEVETFIECGDGHCSTKKAIKFLKSGCCMANKSSMADGSHTASVDIDCCKAKESLMADDIHTASLDIDCSSEEAIKLFIFVSYMAELQSGSLKSYDSNSKTVYVRRFIESINAYVRSGYPPLQKLELKGVVVR
ncbi:hypothetical protein SUGI_0096390 [Cryptomeria japonica]|uniref:uncharacterized protein LOC131059172 n=1 Tax=Cryptomeria japonica TaxID=3369 RepID=UPI002408F0A4|nr:uncharacterized protein LOC131059172 [Cryptomeria japonica]XP_057848493.1 uncharacterized protein LOC131059172 [Cryptomeria japonica]XP_059077581.1 uncharacterized protein LOC131059172 [Cryptomeria japonica]GLJ08809.1 hypothetical protein SUGI_0096390 [Cryptomeria japonica]